MQPKDRLKELCAQLCRAENPEVIEAVAVQLRAEIDVYVSESQQQHANVNVIPSPVEPPA